MVRWWVVGASLTVALEVGAGAAAPLDREPDHAFAGRDATVAPGNDFFGYANGGWLRQTTIPADRSGYGTSAQMQEQTDRRLAELLREAATSDAPAGSDKRRVGDYFDSFMDEDGIDAKGLAPLQPALDAIAAIDGRSALARELGRSLRADVDVLNLSNTHTANILGLWVAQDMDDPQRYVPFLLQGGLGMPDRDYYLEQTPRMAAIGSQYRRHIAALLKLAGDADAGAQSQRIFDLEVRIARGHVSRAETADVHQGRQPLVACPVSTSRRRALIGRHSSVPPDSNRKRRSSSGSRGP